MAHFDATHPACKSHFATPSQRSTNLTVYCWAENQTQAGQLKFVLETSAVYTVLSNGIIGDVSVILINWKANIKRQIITKINK